MRGRKAAAAHAGNHDGELQWITYLVAVLAVCHWTQQARPGTSHHVVSFLIEASVAAKITKLTIHPTSTQTPMSTVRDQGMKSTRALPLAVLLFNSLLDSL